MSLLQRKQSSPRGGSHEKQKKENNKNKLGKLNITIGDKITTEKTTDIMRIYFQNANGISTEDDWCKFKDLCQKIQEHKIDAFGLVETNLPWSLQLQHRASYHTTKIFSQIAITTCTSDEPTSMYNKPGCVMMGITNNYMGRIIETQTDPMELGLWVSAMMT
eukprot:2613623-Ditylum_brightwellii.AAC.1